MSKKILFILHYYPPVHGSAIIGKIIKENNNIKCRYNTRFVNLNISYKINDIGKGKIVKLFRYFTTIYNTLKQLILFRPDLCYMTPVSKGIGFYKDFIIIFIVKIFKVRIIYHFHNKGISSREDKFFDNILYKFTFKDEHVILLSKLLFYDIEKYVSKEKVYYCPNGIPELNFKIEDNGPEKKIVNILFLSNLIKSKGVLILVEACKILKSRKIDYSCTIAGGEGDLTINEIQEEILLSNLSQNISIYGMIQGRDKIEIFRNADIFVFPSFYHNECMPLVLLEAMQYSLPVVTTSEGAIPDLVEDGMTGYIIPPRDVEALADKLEHLIQNPEKRESMGLDGFKRYQKYFTLDLFENRITDILDDVLRKNTVL